jgi:hypothetical protein
MEVRGYRALAGLSLFKLFISEDDKNVAKRIRRR